MGSGGGWATGRRAGEAALAVGSSGASRRAPALIRQYREHPDLIVQPVGPAQELHVLLAQQGVAIIQHPIVHELSMEITSAMKMERDCESPR